MTKAEIHQRFIQQLSDELETITAAAKNTFDVATHEESQAKSKYDTFGLESSYLARGQALRVEELTGALQRMHALPLLAFGPKTGIDLSALVRLGAADGTHQTLFISPVGGGEEIMVDDEEIIIVTPSSPLGRAVMSKVPGAKVEMMMGGVTQQFTVLSVE
ncbi:MAG: hypothetical protein ACI9TH_000874 [Kiritimatiellia bacterium]|jgi:hypothetical protein